MKIIEIQSTFPDLESASDAVQKLLSKKVIACGNIVASQSFFNWEGKINKESESMAMIKTSIERKENAIQEITKLHPYETPAILFWEVEANEDYGNWVNKVTNQTT